MKKYLSLLALLGCLVSSPAFAVTTWYISNTTSNGYTLGVDANNCTAKATPCLTINGAMTHAGIGSGDTFIVNPSTSPSAHPYIENNGSGFLQIYVGAALFETDPTYQALYGNAIVQPVAATTRTANLNNIAINMTIQGITFDGLDKTQNQNGIAMHNVSAGNTLTIAQCRFRNMAGGGGTFAVSTPTSGTQGNLIFDLDTFESTVGAATDIGATWTNFTLSGDTFNNTIDALTDNGSGGATITYLHITKGSDGVTPTTLNATGANGGSIYLSSAETITKLEMDNTVVALYGGIYIPHGTAVTSTHVLIHDNSMPGTMASPTSCQASSGAFFGVTGDIISADIEIYGNKGIGTCPMVNINSAQSSNIQMPPAGKAPNNYVGANSDAYQIGNTGTGLIIGPGNTWQSTGTGVNVGMVGWDGSYFVDAKNTATTTGSTPLGSAVGNIAVAQQFITSAASTTTHSPFFANVAFNLSSHGSPTGNITASLYACSGGTPTGSALATSAYTYPASSISSTPGYYYFLFHGGYSMTAGTNYCVALETSASADASNYINILYNAAYTGTGTISNGTVGLIWTQDASHSAMFSVQTAPYGISGYNIHGDKYIGAITSGSSVEGLILAGVGAGNVYQNIVTGGTIGLGIKQSDGSVGGSSIIFSGNIVNAGTLHACEQKADYAVTWENNTCVLLPNTGGSGAFASGSDTLSGGLDNGIGPAIVNAAYSDTTILENNIFYAVGTPTQTYTMYLYTTGGTVYTGNINNTFNYNDIWGGTNVGVSDQYHTWTLWQGAGFDANGINVDPKILNEVNPTTPSQFMTTSTSPVIGVGNHTYAPATGDYFRFVYSNPPDIGAFNVGDYYNFLSAVKTSQVQNLWF